MKILQYGKDQEMRPCVELDDGTVVPVSDVVRALFSGDDGRVDLRKVKRAVARADLLSTYESAVNWADLTSEQIDAYIDGNVTNLASATVFLKKLSRAVLFLLQRELQ